MNNQTESSGQMAAKAEPKMAGRTQADIDVAMTVQAEAITVDASTWTQCSQGNAEAVGQAVILILTR